MKSWMLGRFGVAVRAAAVLAAGIISAASARGQGGQWLPLSSGVSGSVSALAVLPNGDLVASGNFIRAGSVVANSIARWNGSSWAALGAGTSWIVQALAVLPNGDLVAGGYLGLQTPVIARWNGSSWVLLGSGMSGAPLGYPGPYVNALAVVSSGDLFAGGVFTTAGGVAANCIARWNGLSWVPLASGMNGGVVALSVTPNRDLFAGGAFTSAGGVAVNGIARWNGSSWAPLASGVGGGSQSVFALAALPNGNLIAGGAFTTASGVRVNNIARWDGSSWTPLGSGMNDHVLALVVVPNGDVIAGGQFTTAGGMSANRIARWNGASWAPLGTGMNNGIYALAALPNGNVIASGIFTTAGGGSADRIARFSSPLGPPQMFQAGDMPTSVASANFNNDVLGRNSLAVANAGDNTVTVLLNVGLPGGAAAFAPPTAGLTFAVGTEPRSIVTADLNGDTRPDLVVANAGSNTVSVLLNQGGGVFSQAPLIATQARPISVTIDDLDRDGRPDLIVACQNSGTTQIFRNLGGGAFTNIATLQHAGSSGRPTSTGAGDLDGDKRDDVVITDGASGVCAVFRNLGNFTFAPALTFPVAASGTPDPRSLVLADVDGDGMLDIATANRGANSVGVLRNRGVGGSGWNGLAAPVALPVGGQPTSITSANLYGAGKADLLVANSENTAQGGSLSEIRNLSVAPGSVQFDAEFRIATPPDTGFVTNKDINADGRPDAITANSTLAGQDGAAAGSRARGSAASPRGSMGTVATLLNLSQQLRAPCPGDANGDGVVNFLDFNLLLANYGAQSVSPYTRGDVNGDGRVDFFDLSLMLGNYGSAC